MTGEEARRALELRLVQLTEEDRISAEGRRPVELQQDSVGRLSRIDAMQMQAMALAAQQRRTAERARIKGAFERIDQGEWGYCVVCGEKIAEKRLHRDPGVSHCVTCAGGIAAR